MTRDYTHEITASEPELRQAIQSLMDEMQKALGGMDADKLPFETMKDINNLTGFCCEAWGRANELLTVQKKRLRLIK